MSLNVAADPVPLAMDADGVIRVSCTRITLDTIVAAYREGATAEAIVEQYPSVPLADVHTVIGYYLRHQQEVDAYLEQRRQLGDKTRAENERKFPPAGVRDRLIARRHTQG